MKPQKQFLTVALTLLLLAACSKKPVDDRSSQNPPSSSTDLSAQATPPPAADTSPAQATPPPAADTSPAQVPLPPPPPKPKPKPIVVPAGTILTVRLQEALSSKTNSQGDPFNATLAQPLVVGGKSVVPAGSSVSGTVTEAHKAGRFKGGATLDIALNTIAIGSHTYQISTLTMSQTSKGKGKRTAVMAGGGAGVGAMIGGLAGGGKGAIVGALVGGGAGTAGAGLTGNRDISMPAESAVTFQMTRSLKLPPPPDSSDNPPSDNPQQ
jgi:hypothetical protein